MPCVRARRGHDDVERHGVCAAFACVVDLLFLVVGSPSLYWLAATLFIVANVAYGLTIVYYYSYLPLIVDDHKCAHTWPPHAHA